MKRSEEHAKTLMKTVVGIKIKNLSKYEKDWRRKKEAERLAEDPVTRCGKAQMMEMVDELGCWSCSTILLHHVIAQGIQCKLGKQYK